MSTATATRSMNDPINWTRYRPGQKKGHYESFYQRANHPTKPWAFWIRYTIFSPDFLPSAAIGELWSIFFDGEIAQHAVAKEEYPLSKSQFDREWFSARVKYSVPAPGILEG